MTMIYKTHFYTLFKTRNLLVTPKRYSALFINGAKATENYVYVTPYLDFPENFQNINNIKDDLKKRKYNYNFEKLEELWHVYEELKQKRNQYEQQKDQLAKELGKIIKNESEKEAINKLKLQITLIKDDIRKIKAPLWSAEEAAVVEALKLPNNLHDKTPESDSQIVYTHLKPPKNDKNHIKIGQDLNLITIKNNENYYLKGDAAIFELGAKFLFSDILKKNNFIQFSNPDFVKSVIVEGCGINHTIPDTVFILHHNEDTQINSDSRLHLTGGGSLCSYMAYHAKNVLYPKVLPLKYFNMGRQYVPVASDFNSLLTVSQAAVVEFFAVTKAATDIDEMLDNLIEILKQYYSRFDYHFRISMTAAHQLNMWESLRLSVEMYSTSQQKYATIANVSLSGDFISKRLMFTYVDNKVTKFPHILSGTLLNVPKFLACVLEQDNDFCVPDILKPENWSL